MKRLHAKYTCPKVITSDISPTMIADAIKQGLPAIRQPAQRLVLQDLTLDGVIFAYGTHHIQPEYRITALQEAYRVLRTRGTIVIQDFESGTPTARWYSELMDKYTFTGHRFQHFTKELMFSLLVDSGFTQCKIISGYDPFVIYGKNEQQAKENLFNYLLQLFSLEKIANLRANYSDKHKYWQAVEEILSPYTCFNANELPKRVSTVKNICVISEGNKYRAELPRVVLIGIGRKR